MPSAKEQDVIAFIEDPTEENRNKIHAKYIPAAYRNEVAARLPENMHINDKVLRYRAGKAPGSLEQLKPENGVQFKHGNKGAADRPTRVIREAYRQAATQIRQSPVTKVKKTVAECMADMHVQAMFDTFEKAASNGKHYGQFDRLATDFRLNAGELPVQETDNTHRDEVDPYTRATVNQLIKLNKALLTRYELPQQAEIISIDTKDEVGHDKEV